MRACAWGCARNRRAMASPPECRPGSAPRPATGPHPRSGACPPHSGGRHGPDRTDAAHALPAHQPRRQSYRVHDVLIARATAQMAGQHVTNLRLVRIRLMRQQLRHRHQDPRRAEAALQAVQFMEGLLDRMQGTVGPRQPFHRADIAPLGLHRQHQAAARRTAIHQHGARAAHAMLAAHMGAGHAQLATQEIRQIHPRLGASLPGCAIDAQPDGQRLCVVVPAHGGPSS